MNINELIFKKTDKYPDFDKKWITKELFDQNMVISNLHLSKQLPMNTTFLRRLALFDNESHNFQFIHLNKFVHLQHLELNYFREQSHQGIIFLNLPKLKILRCKYIFCKLVFNTPALTTVYMAGTNDVRFRNLPKLKLLDYDSYYENGDYGLVFNRIKNVEVFRMQYFINFHIIWAALRHIKKLEEIRWEFNFDVNLIKREYFQKCLHTILEKRRNLNRKNVKIYIFGILLEDNKSFDDYGFENIERLDIR